MEYFVAHRLRFRAFVRWAMAVGDGEGQKTNGYPTPALRICFRNFELLIFIIHLT